MLEAILEARRELWQWTKPDGRDNDRLKDVIYLDLALEAAVRQVMEAQIAEMSKRAPLDVLKITGMVLENLCLILVNLLPLILSHYRLYSYLM